MSVAEEKDTAAKKKTDIQSILTKVTAAFALISALGTSAWFMLSPRLNQYIDDYISKKHEFFVASQPGSTSIFPGSDLDARMSALNGKISGIAELQKQVSDLAKTVSEIKTRSNLAFAGYSFRFKGSDILARRQPFSRLYFYATPDDEVRVSVYLASQKFPVTMKVDGTPVKPVIRDSREGIKVTDQLIQTSLEEVTPIKEADASREGVPPTVEDPRPRYVHYIEFVPGDVMFSFGVNDDYDVSGVVLVTKKIM